MEIKLADLKIITLRTHHCQGKPSMSRVLMRLSDGDLGFCFNQESTGLTVDLVGYFNTEGMDTGADYELVIRKVDKEEKD